MHTKYAGQAESQIWRSLIAGDRNAFAWIFEKYFKKLVNYGYKIIPDKDLVKDCVQDLFIQLWNTREKLSYTEAINYYLIKSLRGKLLRILLKKKRSGIAYLAEMPVDFEFTFSFEEELYAEESQMEQQEQLLKALNGLSKKQKEIIYLKYFNNLTYLEIAEIMVLNYQVVRNYACKAIKSLRKKVDLVVSLLLILRLYHQISA